MNNRNQNLCQINHAQCWFFAKCRNFQKPRAMKNAQYFSSTLETRPGNLELQNPRKSSVQTFRSTPGLLLLPVYIKLEEIINGNEYIHHYINQANKSTKVTSQFFLNHPDSPCISVSVICSTL